MNSTNSGLLNLTHEFNKTLQGLERDVQNYTDCSTQELGNVPRTLISTTCLGSILQSIAKQLAYTLASYEEGSIAKADAAASAARLKLHSSRAFCAAASWDWSCSLPMLLKESRRYRASDLTIAAIDADEETFAPPR